MTLSSLFYTFWHSLYRIFLTILNIRSYLFHPTLLFLELAYFCEELLSFFIFNPLRSKKISLPTYGTLPFFSMNKISPLLDISKDSTLLDLGSGKGKILLYYSLCYKCRCIGIESFSYFYRLSNMLSRLLFQHSRITWLNQDFFSYTPSSTCDIAFVSALDHTEHALRTLIHHYHDHVSTFVSLGAPLPSLDHFSVVSYKLPCSWGFSWIYIYHKKYV
ncbi:hypothetical protein DID78_02590 [Candidatus Marinamargulisbacteria bacterium SCGC AG-343-D04]|nr:hypothetical protein DID78_02590 [Candidatus Marinamargulisbacteria bacterium SCGC AG-343-D04]